MRWLNTNLLSFSFFLAFLIFFNPTQLSAQGATLSGRVVDIEGEPIEFVSIIIEREGREERSLIESDSDGHFSTTLKSGSYHLTFQLMGYTPHSLRVVIEEREVNLNEVKLTQTAQQLEAARVTERRLEYSATGYLLNIKNSREHAALNLSEILRSSPGVAATTNSLTLYGKRVAEVHIDHRVLKMTGEQLIDYLASLRGGEIEKIEMVTTAGAQYGERAVGSSLIKITTLKEQGGTLLAEGRWTTSDNSEYSNSFFARKDKFAAGVNYSYLRDKTEGGEGNFLYDERLYAPFLSYSYTFDKFALSL